MFPFSRLHADKPSTSRGRARSVVLKFALFGFLPPVHYDLGGPGQLSGTVSVYENPGDVAYRLVIPNQASDEVRLFTGHPNGTFSPGGTIPTGAGTGPFDTQMLYDYNGDGKLDMAVANRNNNTISIYLGNGDGTFQPNPVAICPVGKEPCAVTTLALRRNSHVWDIAVPNFGDGSVTILLGNGDGTFEVGQTIPTGSASEYVIGRDFDGDGNIDLVTANRGSNTISVLLGNGDGTFQNPRYFAVGNTDHSNPANAVPEDFRNLRDGTFDLVTANFGEGTVSVLLGNHDGTFQPAVTYPVGINPLGDGDVNPHFVSTADYNGDGIPDLVVANMCDGGLGTVSALLGNGDGTFQPALNFDLGLGMGPLYVAAGCDVNGDGLPDLIVSNQLEGKFSVLINDGNWHH